MRRTENLAARDLSSRTTSGAAARGVRYNRHSMPDTLQEADSALREIAARVGDRQESLARETIERFRAEIVDYANASDELTFEVLTMARYNIAAFVAHLGTGVGIAPEELERLRQGVARRVHQGISLAAVSHAYHLFGEILWDAVREEGAAAGDPDATIEAAGHVMRHVRTVWTSCSQAYVDEAQGVWTDRHVLHRDLLDAVLRGQSATAETRREARALGIDLRDDYAVVVARPSGEDDAAARRRRLRYALDVARETLRSPDGPALMGVRDRELVALVPLDAGPVRSALAATADRFAGAVTGFTVGVGGWHPTPGGVPLAYAEAREAAEIAARSGARDTAVHFEDVLLTHVVNASPAAATALGELVERLRAYDAQRNSELVHTLRAYVESGFSVSRSAEQLIVHANTVNYRLRRIHELTGRDPRDPEDLLTLVLALKLDE